MPKIERRKAVVKLYDGKYESQLSDLLNQAMAAQRREEMGGKRMSTKSESMVLGKQHDDLVAEAEASAHPVTLWAISYNEWGPLADRHPPRPDDVEDKQRGVNMKTFPRDLLYASLAEPGTGDLDEMLAAGKHVLRDLGDLSQVQYVKLETAAWNVNVGDDALPKYSLVSLLKAQRDPDSSPPSGSE